MEADDQVHANEARAMLAFEARRRRVIAATHANAGRRVLQTQMGRREHGTAPDPKAAQQAAAGKKLLGQYLRKGRRD